MKSNFFFKGFLIFLVCLFLVSGVVAETCSKVGKVNQSANIYCDVDGVWQDQKVQGESCLNDYECGIESCSEGYCQSKYVNVTLEKGGFSLPGIWDIILGRECTPGEDDCDGEKLVATCGVEWTWEDKDAYVDGRCGYSSNGGNGDGPGGDGAYGMRIVIYSPIKDTTYGSRTIELKVGDLRNKARHWKYSLNLGSKIGFIPNTTITARNGKNSLTVYATEVAGSSAEATKLVSFSVTDSASTSYCGDDVCDDDEDCSDCATDCGNCVVDLAYCGDDVCDDDESSYYCPEDCDAKEPTSYLWLFILLVILILSAIGFVTFLLFKKYYGGKKDAGKPIKPVKSAGGPPKKMPPFGGRILKPRPKGTMAGAPFQRRAPMTNLPKRLGR